MPLSFPGGLDQSSRRVQWADWLELCLLYTPNETLSREDMRENLDLRYPEEELLDDTVDEAFAEIMYRQTLLGDFYPLRHHGTYLARTISRDDCIVFSFLLALSAQRFYAETLPDGAGWHEPAQLFEYVVTAALQRYLNGRAVRIGTPRQSPVPSSFPDCLAYLEQQTKEPAVRPMNPNVGDGDEDCDVVGWAPFVDGKPGQLIMLTQCSIGQGWEKKLTDLSLDVWGQQMAWHSPLLRAFAVPFLLDDDPEEWRYICRKGGIHFDRVRLSSLVRDPDVHDEIRARIRHWCDGFAARLPLAS